MKLLGFEAEDVAFFAGLALVLYGGERLQAGLGAFVVGLAVVLTVRPLMRLLR